jgi:hypothetical protein
MPLTLTAGVSKKMGLPNYGSLGATCHVELELETALLESDLAGFQQRVRDVYVACTQAVNDELQRHCDATAPKAPEASATGVDQDIDENVDPSVDPNSGSQEPGDTRATKSSGRQDHNGRDDRHNGDGQDGQPASPRQVDYLHVLAGQIRGLGGRRLETLCRNRCGRPLAALSATDASGLIDLLKEVRAGRLNLQGALQGDDA